MKLITEFSVETTLEQYRFANELSFKARALSSFLLLILCYCLDTFFHASINLNILFVLIILEGLINHPYDIFKKILKSNTKIIFYINTTIDIFIITFVIYYLGGITVSFSVLIFIIPLSLSSVSIGSNYAYWLAFLSTLAYVILGIMQYYGIYYQISNLNIEITSLEILLLITTNGIFLFLITYFTGIPSEKLRNHIIERKKIENSLRDERKLLRNIISHIPHSIFWKDKQLVYLGCNDNFAKVAGMKTPQDIVGKTDYDLAWKKEEADIFRQCDRKVINTEKPMLNIEETQLQANGEEATLLTSKVPLRNKEGQVIGILGIYTDFTERKKLEKLIIRAKKEWEQTFDIIPDLIVILDTNHRIIRVNMAMANKLGLSPKEVIGLKCYRCICGNDEPPPYCPHNRLFADGKEHSEEIYIERLKGYFLVTASPFTDVEGRLIGSVKVARDVTERRQAENKLHKFSIKIEDSNAKLKKAYNKLKLTQVKMVQQEKMASIGQLAAGVAHEINNPIGLINSNIGTLKKYIERLIGFIILQTEILESLNENEKEIMIKEKRRQLKIDYILEDVSNLIEESLEGSENIKEIVQNLKSFSRVDETKYKEVNINECIDSALNIVWNELKYNCTIKKEYSNIPLVKCNPQQLSTIFINLLVNASHAIESHGEIVIRTWKNDNHISISISDTGCGIAKENINKIFEPFFTTKEVGKGTGLGLSLVYDAIKKHDGDISVESKLGKGTTFTIKIPIFNERML